MYTVEPSNRDRVEAFSKVSSLQRLKEWYFGQEKVSCLERCPQFRSVLIEGLQLYNCERALVSLVVYSEMEIVLRNHRNGLFIDSGSTVELSCFSHLNDSGDIPFSFNLVSVTSNLTASCDVSTNHEMRCVSPVEDRDWEICRNKTEPHNCVLYLHNFDDSGDGNYSCSTEIAGNRVWSNVLELHTWKNLEPSPNGPGSSSSGLNKLELGIGVGIAVFMVVLVVLFIILSALKSRRRASNGRLILQRSHCLIHTM